MKTVLKKLEHNSELAIAWFEINYTKLLNTDKYHFLVSGNKNDRSSRPEVFCKKVFLEMPQNSQENTCAKVSFLIRAEAYNFIKKETLAQVFSCEFYEISKNTFFDGTPLVAAS